MNERIKELIEQCTTYYNGGLGTEIEVFDKEKFAELIVRECVDCLYMQLDNRYTPEEVLFQAKYRNNIREHFGI